MSKSLLYIAILYHSVRLKSFRVYEDQSTIYSLVSSLQLSTRLLKLSSKCRW